MRRLILEVVEAIAAAIGADRVALRLSPYTDMRGICDDSIQRAIDKNVWLLQVGCDSRNNRCCRWPVSADQTGG
jgi:2,4-dienoyl-CoA reductase-like NADH-dependent reductase (Old Yellow Enzyme family)